MNSEYDGPFKPKPRTSSMRQKEWAHDNRLYEFRTPDGEIYQDRIQRRARDILLKDISPDWPKAVDYGIRRGVFLDKVEKQGKNDFGKMVTDYDDETFLIKVQCVNDDGEPVNCLCIHDWEEQEFYTKGSYLKRMAGCFGGWKPGNWYRRLVSVVSKK